MERPPRGAHAQLDLCIRPRYNPFRDTHFYPAVQVVQAGFFLKYPLVCLLDNKLIIRTVWIKLLASLCPPSAHRQSRDSQMRWNFSPLPRFDMHVAGMPQGYRIMMPWPVATRPFAAGLPDHYRENACTNEKSPYSARNRG